MSKRDSQLNEPNFESLIDHMAHGFAYCHMHYEDGKPSDFTYLLVNAAFEKITGLSDVEGKRVTEVIHGINESNPELFEIYGRVALYGNSESFETYVLGLKVWFAVSVYSPEKDYFVATFEDITKRKESEIALQKSESNLRAMVDSWAK
jgi:PAS domain S-box-containing protein